MKNLRLKRLAGIINEFEDKTLPSGEITVTYPVPNAILKKAQKATSPDAAYKVVDDFYDKTIAKIEKAIMSELSPVKPSIRESATKYDSARRRSAFSPNPSESFKNAPKTTIKVGSKDYYDVIAAMMDATNTIRNKFGGRNDPEIYMQLNGEDPSTPWTNLTREYRDLIGMVNREGSHYKALQKLKQES